MKLSEKEIREIVRQSILLEYKLHRISPFKMSTCDRIDLPDSMFSSAGGKVAIRKAEQAAALGAQLYGVPGMFCNIVSSIFGDNPSFKPNRQDRARREKTTTYIQNIIYENEAKSAMGIKVKFVGNMAARVNSSEADKRAGVVNDRDEYEVKRSQVINVKTSAKTAKEAVSQINSILVLTDEGSSKNAKKLAKAQGSELPVIDKAVEEGLELLRAVTNNNLLNLRQEYSNIDGYKAFVTYTSVR